MTVLSKGDFLYWNIEKLDGTKKQIIIDKTESNKY